MQISSAPETKSLRGKRPDPQMQKNTPCITSPTDTTTKKDRKRRAPYKGSAQWEPVMGAERMVNGRPRWSRLPIH